MGQAGLRGESGKAPEPKDKLDAMTGYSFTTPVWDGGTWVTPAVAGVTAAPKANGPEDADLGWNALDWRAAEDRVRRLRQRIFAAAQAGDHKRVRSLQKLMVRHEALVFSDGGGRPRSPRRRSGGVKLEEARTGDRR